MRGFRNILVGVDLVPGSRSGAPELGPDNREAVRRAIWLASHNSANLLFFSALYVPESPLPALIGEDKSQSAPTAETAIRRGLAALVEEARNAGVKATAQLVRGRAWVEIILQVQRDQHDLVVVGARHLQGFRRIFFGSTAMNLVRKCPCAVWVTKARPEAGPMKVLVASDLSPVTEEALRLGLSLRDLCEAKVHVLHVVEYPLDRLWSTGLPNPATDAYHEKIRAEAMRALEQQLERASEGGSTEGVSLHLADRVAVPEPAILQFLEQHDIDLLIIGTIARTGIPGMFIGNTAERLLPEVSCSVLAVKPAGFQCPVYLE
jgi:universal stress protein E